MNTEAIAIHLAPQEQLLYIIMIFYVRISKKKNLLLMKKLKKIFLKEILNQLLKKSI